jgi:2-(1,2-epoxy-1,2-dihydrophenyl)acetyl-CoA isomerase
MDYQTIILAKEDKVATITLNRPERLNSINDLLIKELASAVDVVEKDDTVRVLIITGSGRAFSAGGDFKADEGRLKMVDKGSMEFKQNYSSFIAPFICKMQNLRIPTIAMVNGIAVGLGFDITLACDIRIGSQNTRFRVAWTKMGLVPAGGGTWLLPRIVGLGKAAELIFSARFIDAEEAKMIGILNKVVPASDLKVKALELAQAIAENPPLAVNQAKMNLYKGLGIDISSALELLGSSQALLMSTDDFKEAVAAFREKRAPSFHGK